MNRADQAPEPSMEELLASIRSIISDADKKAPALGRVNSYARLPGGNSAPDQNAEGDEVLDLTDDLVLAGQAEPATVLSHGAEEPQEPEARQHSSFQKNIRRDGPITSPPVLPAASTSRKDPLDSVAAAKPLWSRREIPFPGAGFEPSAPRSRPESLPPKPQGRAWSGGDVQMPVPEQGPVSLIPSGEQENSAASWAPAEASQDAGSSTFEGDEEAAVAALAHKLARSAAEAMEPGELESAQQVDFEQIGEDSKAEVTERFADAIARESSTITRPALPSLLNEVFRHDFRRETEAMEDSAAGEEPPMSAEPSPQDTWDAAFEERMPKTPGGAGPDYGGHSPSSHVHNFERPSQPSAVAVPAASQALVPSQPSLPAPPVRSLEDAVREMLRPLLVQWLNENMPRILESAIREEIAARGLFPNKDQ